METNNISGKLSAYTIDFFSEKTDEALSGAKISRTNALRLRLSVEEVLLKWLDALGEGAECTFKSGKRLGRHYITLSVAGDKVNPFEIQDDLDFGSSDTKQSILANLGLAPAYSYVNGENQITLMPKKEKRSPIFNLLASIILAVVCGFLVRLFPPGIILLISDGILAPIFDSFMGLLSAMAGPMILLSVMWGIYSIGDTATLGIIGKKMVGRFLFFTYLTLVFIVSSVIWFFDISFSGGGTGGGSMSELYLMLLDIIPSNIITPFIEGNSLQIIFIAVIFGLAMLVLDKKATVAAKFVEQSNYIVQFIMEVISTLVPAFIFVSILRMILSDLLSTIATTIKPIVLVSVGCLAILVLFVALLAIIKKVSPVMVAKKLLPVFMIGLTTASSSAAYASNVETSEKKLGIDTKMVSFGLPLGSVVFMPGTAAAFFIISLCMAEAYDVTITLPWLVIGIFLSGILAIAAPPIPGGALSCYTILFIQLGIPIEALSFAVTIDIVIDFVCTAVNVSSLPVVLVLLANKLHMLDEDILQTGLTGSPALQKQNSSRI